MRNQFYIDGVSTADFGLFVGLNGNDGAPERSVENIVIPGRSGTLTIDNGRFENIDVSYTCFVSKDFPSNMAGFRALVLSKVGYFKLEDTAHPDEYRMAKYKSGLGEITSSQMRRQGYFTVTFDCMPQRFLVSGTIAKAFTGNGAIVNNTLFDAKPLVRVWGNGSVGIGDATFTLTGTTGYTDVDCEAMNAYSGGTNRNSKMSGTFPVLAPGENGVTLGSGITRVEITPRWWTI